MFKINELKTEYQVNPIAVDSLVPKFSWQLASSNSITQTAYQVLVCSSAQLLEANNYDLYDSGLISGEDNVHEYKGRELASRQTCYVIVKAFSNKCEANICGTFTMALLNGSDWLGNWMSMPINNQGGTNLYRKKIEILPKKIVNAKAYICGLGYHEAFVNGVKLSNSVLNPGVTEYAKRVLYCAYDIAPLLNSGDNVFGIELGHGWFGAKKALAQIYIDYSDGTAAEYHSSTNGGWWVSGSPTIDNSIYGGEVYDARLEKKWPKNWATIDFEPSWENGWMFTVFSSPPQGKLELQVIEPIEICDIIKPISINEISKNVFIVDFGINIAGWVRITVSGECGSSATLKFGERLCENGYVNQLNLRSARASDTYILGGNGNEQYAPRFTYHGFQYVQIELSGNCKIAELQAEHVHTTTESVGFFKCSDSDLNKLHDNAVVTEYNNQHSILTDCPQRDERFGWLNDLGSRLYQTIYNCNMPRFFSKFTKDISDTQLESGAIGDTAPFFTGGRPADPVCIAYLLMPIYNYRYYGDKRLALEEYDGLKGWVDFLISQSENYIMKYSYYADWVAPTCFNEHTDNIYVSTLYMFWHAKEMSSIAAILGKADDEKKYAYIADKTKKAINEKYFNKETCNYESGTQAANSIALSLGIAEPCYRQRVANNINADVVKKNYHSSCGNVGYRHMFYMLCEYGFLDTAIKVLKNPEYPGWGFMLHSGATSVWERWESEMSNEMDSFNHPMFGSFDAIFYSFLGGIKVDDNAIACSKITIAPIVASGIDYVNCSFKTLRGVVESCWKRNGTSIEYKIAVPQCTHATVIIEGKSVLLGSGRYVFNNGILQL